MRIAPYRVQGGRSGSWRARKLPKAGAALWNGLVAGTYKIAARMQAVWGSVG